jgi:hypothetical protein
MQKMREEIEQIAEVVVDAMVKVHRALGPGLLESALPMNCVAGALSSRTASSAWSIGYERVGGFSWRSSRLRGDSLFTQSALASWYLNQSVQFRLHPAPKTRTDDSSPAIGRPLGVNGYVRAWLEPDDSGDRCSAGYYHHIPTESEERLSDGRKKPKKVIGLESGPR